MSPMAPGSWICAGHPLTLLLDSVTLDLSLWLRLKEEDPMVGSPVSTRPHTEAQPSRPAGTLFYPNLLPRCG